MIDSESKSIAVIIPCYNEELTIEKVVSDFKKNIPNAKIYVYDNNSQDHTAKIAKDCGAIVVHEYRQGKGNVIRSMFRDINADCYVLVDGDDTYPAEAANNMIDLILSGQADMVVGDRLSSTYFEQNKRRFHNFGNSLVRYFINLLFTKKKHNKIFDVMTGYRCFSPLFVKSFPVISKGFEIETEMTIHALYKGFLIRNYPIKYKDRPLGSESKLNTYSDGFRVLLTIFNLFRIYSPFRFFSILGFLLSFLSIVLFLPVLFEYLRTGMVSKIPTLIVSCFVMMSSLLSLSCGLILDSIRKNEIRDYELKLNIIKKLFDIDRN